MKDEELDKVADKIVDRIRSQGHEFWIDPQEHYDSHARLNKLMDTYDQASNVFMKVFFGAMILGSIILAAISMGFKK